MFSGGELRLVSAADRNKDDTINNDEVKVVDTATGAERDASTLTAADTVAAYGTNYSWTDLKQMIEEAFQEQGVYSSGDNLEEEDFQEIQRTRLPGLKNKLNTLRTEVSQKESALNQAKADLAAARNAAQRTAAQTKIDAATKDLATVKQALARVADQAQAAGATEGDLRAFRVLAGVAPAPAGAGAAAGGSAGGAGKAPAGGGGGGGAAPGGGGGGAAPRAAGQLNGNGGGGAGSGGDVFGGLASPPSSAQYASALYLDQAIGDAQVSMFARQREGQKLMLLFAYYARMAESGDLGAMYQLIQFINYVIAKDKARQNIKISSKLIQLQDLSRKATELLMKTPTDGDPQQVNEFTKKLHEAKSQEAAISTSQKLLADMLQEFAHVVEALTQSSKFLLDAWGRVLRTVTRP